MLTQFFLIWKSTSFQQWFAFQQPQCKVVVYKSVLQDKPINSAFKGQSCVSYKTLQYGAHLSCNFLCGASVSHFYFSIYARFGSDIKPCGYPQGNILILVWYQTHYLSNLTTSQKAYFFHLHKATVSWLLFQTSNNEGYQMC